MEIEVLHGNITEFDADLIIVNLFEGIKEPVGATKAIDKALDNSISNIITLGDMKGKKGEITRLHTFEKIPSPRVIIAGLGEQENFNTREIRNLGANLIRACQGAEIRHIATIAHGIGTAGLSLQDSVQAFVEGVVLGNYRFDRHKTPKEDPDNLIERLTIIENDSEKIEEIQKAATKGCVLAQATNLARDLANEPANHLTPSDLVERAKKIAESKNIELEVLDRETMEAKGMGSLLSVAAGSVQPPKLIRLTYRGKDAEPGFDLALVGKGITFDTGGISIKPAPGMEAMKADMTGAASVIAAMEAISAIKPEINVTAIAPCTENMPGGNATKPGDVVTAMDGTTIEILNTDAEGRLVLADGICYAKELGARNIVDIATLTGAISIALGDQCYGMMGNNTDLIAKISDAASESGERVWELPMFEEYGEQIKSDVSDVKNVGGRPAGSITAAKFLEKFVGETPWVHLDIAGVDMATKNNGWVTKGASGQAVRTLINLVCNWEN